MSTTKLKTSTIVMEDGSRETVTHGTDNIFADLGLPNPEDHLAKSSLVMEIEKAIKARGLSQREAAKVIKMDQPTLSKMLRGQFSSISMDRLFEMLNRLGRHVEIRIRPTKGSATAKTSFITLK